MISAGSNPQDRELPIRQLIVCSILREVTNKLEKGQKPGDATEVENSGKLETLQEGMPIVDTKSVAHKVTIDDNSKEAYRTVNVNGKNMKIKIANYKEAKVKYSEWKKREGIESKDKDQDAR